VPAPRSSFHLAFGRAIREIRHELDISQEELALRAGIQRSYLGGIERGERNPSLANILKIAGTLQVPPSEILRRAEAEVGRNRRS
jgi:transcriptional regulator with XRE-family HTH domain